MRKSSILKFGLTAGPLLFTSITSAQTEEAPTLQEITVTAQQREQSILDVPVTMDLIQGEFLDRTNTTELDDLSRFIPNVVIQEQGASLPSFNIRGITDDSASITATPRISVYQDGIDISKKTVSSVSLYDIERIEVLKGPQPTLFGVAAANGAISMISAQPINEFEANLRMATNTEGGIDVRGMINTPINDIFAFRLAGAFREQDGNIKNLACGPGSYNPSGMITDQNGVSRSCAGGDLNGVSVQALRATLKAELENTDLLLRASVETNEQPGIAFKSGSIAPRNGDTNPFTDAELGLGSLIGIDRDLESLDAAVTHRFSDSLALTVDGYTKDVELSETFDADGTGLRIQDAFFENNAKLSGYGARLVYESGSRFEGFVGFSSTHDESILPFVQMVDPVLRGAFDARLAELEVQFPNISLTNDVTTNASIEEIAAVRQMLVDSLFNADGTPISDPATSSTNIVGPFVFEGELDILSYVAEGSYDLTDKVTLTAGVRYIDETRFSRDTLFNTFTAEGEADFSDVLPRFSLNYSHSNSLSLYFNYAEGRRSPVVDVDPFGTTSVIDAETVDSFDVGLKYYGDRLSFTSALFAYTYKDFQESFTDAQTLEGRTVTVGDSDMFGFESTVDYQVDDTLRVGATLGLLDAKFDGSAENGGAFDFGGNSFRLAPDVSGSLHINKGVRIAGYPIEFEWISSFQSEVFFESSNRPELSEDAYWITDVSVKFGGDQPWRFEVYADNLFDKEYLIDAGNTGGGFGIPTFVAGMPFVAGVRMYADF
ncbi:MAG: TonB-dependent receptor [Pseudohongiella sp.]|uniref:TonB-dependent receptor n=1 Tax=Pseudohongiella sp. TaxID=1979412 RepID=UPI00349FDE44